MGIYRHTTRPWAAGYIDETRVSHAMQWKDLQRTKASTETDSWPACSGDDHERILVHWKYPFGAKVESGVGSIGNVHYLLLHW